MEGGKTETAEREIENKPEEVGSVFVQKPIGDLSHMQNLDPKNNLREIWEGIRGLLKRNKERGQQEDK